MYAAIEARASGIRVLMEALPEPDPVVRIPVLPQPSAVRLGWAVAGLAVAVSAALVFALVPPRRPEPLVAVPVPAAPKAQAPAPPVTVKPAIIKRLPRKRAVPPKPKPQVQYYVALDDQPIETGVVVRVGLDNGLVPADVIVGSDGRPRAIRLISDFSGEQ
jgi:hypothetical protein